jgi:hypothetical protein
MHLRYGFGVTRTHVLADVISDCSRSSRAFNAGVDVVTDNKAQSLVCTTTSTGSATRRTIELSKTDAGTALADATNQIQTKTQ